MSGEENQQTVQDLVRQIQEKSVQLSDLEIILEDYKRERYELLREIGELKASLWELSAETGIPANLPSANLKPANRMAE
jgi:hypothetical protein